MSKADPPRWRTLVTGFLTLIAVIWAIPAAILVVGLPIALLFMGARLLARMM